MSFQSDLALAAANAKLDEIGRLCAREQHPAGRANARWRSSRDFAREVSAILREDSSHDLSSTDAKIITLRRGDG
ncbi:Uncharacterised protein [Mycobacteroides abscessus subsp. abscessus]|nr:Uncharacterised protein [Mycobacteroides abscessus subsp. abscessus]